MDKLPHRGHIPFFSEIQLLRLLAAAQSFDGTDRHPILQTIGQVCRILLLIYLLKLGKLQITDGIQEVNGPVTA